MAGEAETKFTFSDSTDLCMCLEYGVYINTVGFVVVKLKNTT